MQKINNACKKRLAKEITIYSYFWLVLLILILAAVYPLIFIHTTTSVEAANGGPDGYGYEWTDSKDPTPKCTYNWISALAGTNTGIWGDDSYGGPFNIGFNFLFYGNTVTQFYASTNGLVMFSNPTTEYWNEPIPTPGGATDNFIAVLWDDLYVDSIIGGIYYQVFGTSPNRYLVIEWNNVEFLGGSDQITFEAILYEAAGGIKLQYSDTLGNSPGQDNGGDATVGIEDNTGSIGLQYSYATAVITNSLAIEIGRNKPGKIDGFNIVGGFGPKANICGAGTAHTFQVVVSDPNGYNDIEKVIINLDYLNENLSFVWRQAGEAFEEIGDIYGYGSIVSTPSDSYHDSNDQWILDFKIIFDWDFPHENIFGVMVRSWDFSNTELTKYYINIARVENDLELIGKATVSSDIQGPISDGGWVKKDETLNWSGLTAVYEATTDGYPPDTDFDIVVERVDTAESWIDRESSGEPFTIFMPAESDLDIETVEYSIQIQDIPMDGKDLSDQSTFKLKIDGLAPDPPLNIVVHADSVSDTQTYADDDKIIFVTWDSVTSEDSGTGGYYYSFTNNGTTNEGHFTTETSVKISGAEEGVNYVYVWTRDYVGNIGTANSKSIIIDFIEPTIINYTPISDVWQNKRSIACKLAVKDVNLTGESGSGVDAHHVQYSYSTSGSSKFGAWTYADSLTEEIVIEHLDKTTVYTAVANLNFMEGDDNYIKWRVEDLAGNGYDETGPVQVKVDTREVLFVDPTPDPEDWIAVELDDDEDEMTIDYTITLKDTSSGVDAESIEYCYSIAGIDEYGDWTSAEKIEDSTEIECKVNIPVEEGENNYIKWRAKDVAGNGYTESEDYKIKINTRPVVIITSPEEGVQYTTKDNINFNGLQTSDVDGDDLKLYWQSNVSGSVGTGSLFTSKLFPGYHQITLFANDGNGHNVTGLVNISVLDMDKDTDNDGFPDALDTDDDNDGLLDIDEKVIGTDPLDSDTDGDKADDGLDEFPMDSKEWEDTDGDGIGNNADLDDDEDGYPDSIDSFPLDPSRHEETKDTDSNLIMAVIGIVIVIVLIMAMWFYIGRKQQAEEEKMEMEMADMMPGTATGFPPSQPAQSTIEYLPQQPITYYGLQQPMPQTQQAYGTGQQFALQPSPDQPIYQPQYQLPPAPAPEPQPIDPNQTQGYVQTPAQMGSYYQLPPADTGQPSPYRQELDLLENQLITGQISQEEFMQRKNELDYRYPNQQ
jgi:hypothetical protein